MEKNLIIKTIGITALAVVATVAIPYSIKQYSNHRPGDDLQQYTRCSDEMHSHENSDDLQNCSICLDEMHSNDSVRDCTICLNEMHLHEDLYAPFQCDHEFHRECIQPWLENGGAYDVDDPWGNAHTYRRLEPVTCPNCRAPLK